MNRASQDKLIQRFRIVSRGAGMIVALVGGMVLIGWVGDITELTNILPDYVAMKANTAIAFLLSGIALWLLREVPPTTPLRTTMGRACALLALMLGLLTLAEYVSNIPLGIDEALFRDSQSAVQTSHPGRMAPNSAANFVLLGLALLLADFGHTRWFRPSEFLALTAFGIAMLPFTGYLYGVSSLVGYTHRYTAMAIHTSAAFLVLSTGILFMRTNRGWMQLVTSGGAAGLIMRLLFPLTVIMLVVLGWLRLAGEQAGFYTSESGTSVFVLIRIVLIGAIIAGVARVVHHLERVRDAAQEDLERANRGLEQRVQQRTREVEESNRALVEEVQHRARVEQALRESESRLQAILHGSPVAQFVIDRDHSVISWNRPLEEYTGIKAETMLGTSQQWRAFYPSERPCLADLLLEGEREQMRQWYGSKVTPSELVEGAYEATDFFPNLGDAGRWLYFMAAVIRGPEGDVIGAVETLRDITDRKRAEEARYLDEQRLDALLRLNQMTRASMKELTDFALEEAVRLTKSKIGYLAFMNEDESVLTMYSWSRSAMSQCTVQEKPIVYPVRDTGLWGEAVRQRRPVITNDYTVPSPLKKGFPEGHVPILRHMNIPVMDEGRIVAVAGVGNKDEPYDESDTRQLTLLMEGMWRILQRRRTEDAIRHMRAYLQNVVNSMPSVLVGIDLDGAVTHWNREAARLTGMEEADVKGRDFGDVLPQLQGQLEKVRAAIREGQALENERFGARNSEQDMRFYDLMVYPLIANGTQGAVLRLDDVTSRV
ncbi:MAG TPA: GAF domain-containing protein, partial [Candidatus Hydrogenedentes bacterium]|nr:GAF domain-containing protein [Candidatus Hydrogenedentota bacterium]